MGIEDFLAKAAEKQLDKATDAVKDGAWLDDMVAKLKAGIDNSQLNDTVKEGSHLAVAVLEQNRDKIVGLGANALNLMVHQIVSGKSDAAVETYIRSLGSAQAIVDAMDRGTAGLIAAKRQLDQWHADAWDVVKNISDVAMQLLSLLLTLA